jgi:hypothetical protein
MAQQGHYLLPFGHTLSTYLLVHLAPTNNQAPFSKSHAL